MAVGINVDVDLLSLSEQNRERLAALNTEAILDNVSALFLNRIRTRFLQEEGYAGKWKPSKAAIERRGKGGTGTLFKTGKLFRSIQSAATGPNQRSIFTDVKYAPYLQSGTRRMPARPFIGVNADDRDSAERLILNLIQEAFK